MAFPTFSSSSRWNKLLWTSAVHRPRPVRVWSALNHELLPFNGCTVLQSCCIIHSEPWCNSLLLTGDLKPAPAKGRVRKQLLRAPRSPHKAVLDNSRSHSLCLPHNLCLGPPLSQQLCQLNRDYCTSGCVSVVCMCIRRKEDCFFPIAT